MSFPSVDPTVYAKALDQNKPAQWRLLDNVVILSLGRDFFKNILMNERIPIMNQSR